ncbi:MAG: hypothetical protein ACPGQI_09720 [Gammaproteobacteria bacterium]
MGAPWLDGRELARRLNAEKLPGVLFREAWFTPTMSKFDGERLRRFIVGSSSRVAQWKIAEQKARYTSSFNNVFSASHNNSGNAIFFQVTCDQTHGLVTHRSIGNDDGNVCLVGS